MNRKVSFCIKNSEGLVSLVRTLTIKPDGACYISYGNNNNYHFSMHPPNTEYTEGQMHVKVNGKMAFKHTISGFNDFNKHRCFESVLILESELREAPAKIPNSVLFLELPKDCMAHIMFIRSDKSYGQIKAAFISDKPTQQPDEHILAYPAFYSVEDMPNANYYLTYNVQPIDDYLRNYIDGIKVDFVKSGQFCNGKCAILHIRHPLLSTDMEITVNAEDFTKYGTLN